MGVFKKAFLLALACFFSGCAGTVAHSYAPASPTHSASGISPSILSRLIDPQIIGAERDRIARTISQGVAAGVIPISDAKHVSVTVFSASTGQFYVNTPSIRSELALAKPTGKPGEFRFNSGRTVHAPVTNPTNPVFARKAQSERGNDFTVLQDDGSGPYRRIFSASLGNFWQGPSSYNYVGPNEIANIKSPCNAQTQAAGSSATDIGDIYMGGWGQTGGAIDAGLQYNLLNPQGPQDVYQLFFNASGYGYVSSQTGPYEYHPVAGTTNPPTYDWPCANLQNDTFQLEFMDWGSSPASGGEPTPYIEFWIVATDFTKGTSAVLAVDIPYPYGGWTGGSCSGCIFKRMTSIAQQGNEDFSDGTTFGPVSWISSELTCNLNISGCFIGAIPSSPNNVSAWTPPLIAGCSENPSWSGLQAGDGVPPYPNDCNSNTGNQPVQVQYTDPANEVDFIALDGQSHIGGSGGSRATPTPAPSPSTTATPAPPSPVPTAIGVPVGFPYPARSPILHCSSKGVCTQ